MLGLWHRTETAAALWPLLPPGLAPIYHTLQPATADANRLRQWLAARVLLHRLLPELLPTDSETWLENDASGRPLLRGPRPAATTVAVSHSGEWAAVLLSVRDSVGVDIEVVRGKAQRLAAKFLSETEAAAAALTPTAAHFTLLWSAKETLYKLAGRRGLIFKTQLLLDDFEPVASGTIPAVLWLDGVATRHRVCYCQLAPGYVLTYAVGTSMSE